MSLSLRADTTNAIRGFDRVNRVTIRVLSVRERSVSGCIVDLPPGTVLSDCQVLCDRASEETEPYQVLFHALGRAFACPLYAFQPRTECRLTDAEPSAEPQTALAV